MSDAGAPNFGDFLKIYEHVHKIQNIDLKPDIISLKHPHAQALNAHIKNIEIIAKKTEAYQTLLKFVKIEPDLDQKNSTK